MTMRSGALAGLEVDGVEHLLHAAEVEGVIDASSRSSVVPNHLATHERVGGCGPVHPPESQIVGHLALRNGAARVSHVAEEAHWLRGPAGNSATRQQAASSAADYRLTVRNSRQRYW